MSDESTSPSILRTLAPLLRALERQFRTWLDARRRYPVSIVQRAQIDGLTEDLHRQSEALDVDRPLLIVMLMGGTGVGKSTLMNALAGAPVAQSSFARPTTREPVVYHHRSVKPEQFDPALRLCRFAQHDRESLRDKVIIDTPDVDSNDITNREKLLAVLPVADIVLYVGSQEKYHDRLVWELFKTQRQRRAFAFVLNKWDRCIDVGEGVRPDHDLLADLRAEGFENPRLFRTTAQFWIDAEKEGQRVPPNLPPGEQFRELREWLELGLTRLEIEAVKARGVGQLIAQAAATIEAVRPPDYSHEAVRVRTAWTLALAAEADEQADVLVGTLVPYQQEIEHHFSVLAQQRFRGLMAGYLRLTTKLRYFGSTLRDRMPFVPRLGGERKVETPDDWNFKEFMQSRSRTATDRVMAQRLIALNNRLLVEADQKGFPANLLGERTQEAAQVSWEEKYDRGWIDSLGKVEQEVTRPTGWRRIVRGGVALVANALPELVLVASIIIMFFMIMVEREMPTLMMVGLPVYSTLASLVLMHLLVSIFLPVRWSAIRKEFRQRLGETLHEELNRVFLPIPDELAGLIREEKRQSELLASEVRQVADYLNERERAASVSELYGRPGTE